MILSSPLDYPFIYNAASAPPESPVELFQKRGEDLRVENWVKSQVASNAFMLTAAQAYAQAQPTSRYSTKGHRRRRPLSHSNRRHRNQDPFYDQLRLSFNDSPYHGAGAPHLSTISELEEDIESEQYIFYSTSHSASSASPIDSHLATFVLSSPPMSLAAPKPCYPLSFTPSPPNTPSPPPSPSATAYSASTVTPQKTLKHRRGSCSSLSSLSSLESIPEED